MKRTLLLLLLISSSLTANTTLDRDIDKAVPKGFSGMIHITKNMETIFSKAYGGDYNIDTRFQIASVTKQFTGAIILMLQEEGKLRVDDPIDNYIDIGRSKDITIHHLLTHSSGIPEYFYLLDKSSGNIYSPEEIVELVEDRELTFKPGSSFNYSNSNYVILGMIIESIEGKSLDQVYYNRIFEPLKMANSGATNNYLDLENIAIGYDRVDQSKKSRDIGTIFTKPLGDSSIYSTARDLNLWHYGLFGGILSDESKELMFNKQIGFLGIGYSYGLFIYKDGAVMDHLGSTVGFQSIFYRDIERDLNIIILYNLGMTMDINSVKLKIIEVLNRCM